MSSLGSYLRELRERRGLSLEEISRATRVARPYLEALESSQLQKLPAPVFTRGFIRAYCQMLGEPAEEALRRYDSPDHEAPAETTRAASLPSEKSAAATRGRGPLLISFILLVILGAALFAVTLALQSGREAPAERRVDTPERRGDAAPVEPRATEREAVTASSRSTPGEKPAEPAVTRSGSVASAVTSHPPSSTTAATATPPPTSSPPTAAASGGAGVAPAPRPATIAPAAPAVTPGVVAAIGAVSPPYRLVARTTEPTWIRVRTEDGHVSEETVQAGQVREWVSNGRFTVTVGNAGGVAFELNGRPLPSLGSSGQVVRGLVLPPEAP